MMTNIVCKRSLLFSILLVPLISLANQYELKGIVRIDDLVQVSIYSIESGQSFWLSNTDPDSRPIRLISLSDSSREAVISAFGELHSLELSDELTPINIIYQESEASEYAKAIETAAEFLKNNPTKTIINAPLPSRIKFSLEASHGSYLKQRADSHRGQIVKQPGEDGGTFYNDFSRAALIRRAYLINLDLLKASNPEGVEPFKVKHKAIK